MSTSDKALDIILEYTASSEWVDVKNMNWTTSEVQELLTKALSLVKKSNDIKSVSGSCLNIDCDGDVKPSNVCVKCGKEHYNDL